MASYNIAFKESAKKEIRSLGKKEIKKILPKIVAFSGLKKFIEMPLYAYSEGMVLRLGCSTVLFSNPEILIADDANSFADENFRKKWQQKIKKLGKENGLIEIFSSHELELISSTCSKVIWLERGKIKRIGPPKEIISAYKKAYNSNSN